MADTNKDGGIDQPELEKVLAMMQQMRRPAASPAAQAAPAATNGGE